MAPDGILYEKLPCGLNGSHFTAVKNDSCISCNGMIGARHYMYTDTLYCYVLPPKQTASGINCEKD